MNALIFVALCCAVAGASAQAVLPNWLPQMVPYACVWCSGRYYRRSPQYLTTGSVGAVGSVGAQSRDLSAHAGYFYDIIPKKPVKSEKQACKYLVDMYRGSKGPVVADEIMTYINMSFFGPQQTKDYSDKPHPLAFQCCHYKYGRQLMDTVTGGRTEDQQQDDVVSTTEVPVSTDVSTEGTTDITTEVPVRRNVDNKRNPRHNKKQDLGSRTVIPNVLDSDISAANDQYKAPMPQILPEGYDCNMLTRQLYMELSQDNVVRQKQIQKAMQSTTGRRQARRPATPTEEETNTNENQNN